MEKLNKERDYSDINEVIELYEIYRLFQGSCIREEYVKPYSEEMKKIPGIVARYFKKITSNDFQNKYESVCIGYVDSFWKIVDKFKVYENISENVFGNLLNQPETTLCKILENKSIVNHFDKAIADNMRNSEQSARILVSQFLEKKTSNIERKCYLPTSLLPTEYEDILLRYILSPNANVGVVQLIAQSQNSKECPLSDKLRLQARKTAKEYWEKHAGEGVHVEYGIGISFEKCTDLISCMQETPGRFKFTYDIEWLEENIDYPTILNNFIYLFQFTDLCGRSQFPAQETKLGVFERTLGIKGIKEYITGTEFLIKDMKSSAEMRGYKEFLLRHEIRIEHVLQWFFEEYLNEEFTAKGFIFNEPSEGSSLLEKCRSLPSEMDGILKQYKMYVEEGNIDRELLEMSSNPIVIADLPSFIDKKYAYANSSEIRAEMNLMFSDQCMLSYVPKYGEHYNTFYDLISREPLCLTDYRDYDMPDLEFLKQRGTIIITDDNQLHLNRERAKLLKDLYYNGVICPSYYRGNLVQEFVDAGELIYEGRLFSRPEKEYLNYVLNKSEFANGKDLRNKYIHSTYPTDERTQESDYIYLLKIMIFVILKINEEFTLKDMQTKNREQ